jgi:hypothetical protein
MKAVILGVVDFWENMTGRGDVGAIDNSKPRMWLMGASRPAENDSQL